MSLLHGTELSDMRWYAAFQNEYREYTKNNRSVRGTGRSPVNPSSGNPAKPDFRFNHCFLSVQKGHALMGVRVLFYVIVVFLKRTVVFDKNTAYNFWKFILYIY